MKKLFALTMLAAALALTGCGKGGGKKGSSQDKEIKEEEFSQIASENLAKENPYTTASMTTNKKQVVGATTTHNLNGTASYARDGGSWTLTESNIDDQLQQFHPESYINFTMDRYATFVTKFREMVGDFDKLAFTTGKTYKVVIEKGMFTFNGMDYNSVNATIEWDEYGQLLLFDEKDSIDYSGAQITVTDNIQFTYSA